MNIAYPHRYRLKLSSHYKRDYRKLRKSHADVARLEAVIDALLADEHLPERCRDCAPELIVTFSELNRTKELLKGEEMLQLKCKRAVIVKAKEE